MNIESLFHDIKIGVSVATATSGSGLATFLQWIPQEVGKLATLIGIVLSAVLIFTHLRKSNREAEKHNFEIELLRRQLEDSKVKNKKEGS